MAAALVMVCAPMVCAVNAIPVTLEQPASLRRALKAVALTAPAMTVRADARSDGVGLPAQSLNAQATAIKGVSACRTIRAHAHLVTEGMTAGSGYALKAVRVVDYASRMLSVHASTADLASIARRDPPSRLQWAWSMRRRLLLVWCRICWRVVPTAYLPERLLCRSSLLRPWHLP